MAITGPLVTIAIPTYYRAGGYLRQALASAVAQTHPGVEILVADNCSPDRTADVVAEVGDARTRYVRHDTNIGANANFNFCVEQARGRYFVLLHDDDRVDPDFVEACLAAVPDGAEVGIVRAGTRVVDDQDRLLWEMPNRAAGLTVPELFRAWFRGATTFYLCSTLFNTRRLRDEGGFRSRHNLFQDVAAALKLAARHGRADVEAVKGTFRKHPEAATSAARLEHWCEDSRDLLDLMCELAGDPDGSLRRDGLRFLAQLNYNRAAALASWRARSRAYLAVYRRFDYRYSPLTDIYRRQVRSRLYRLGARVKQAGRAGFSALGGRAAGGSAVGS